MKIIFKKTLIFYSLLYVLLNYKTNSFIFDIKNQINSHNLIELKDVSITQYKSEKFVIQIQKCKRCSKFNFWIEECKVY